MQSQKIPKGELTRRDYCDTILQKIISAKETEIHIMKRITTLKTRNLCKSAKNGGCGECQTSCQSACTTSCGVANQSCENKKASEKKN